MIVLAYIEHKALGRIYDFELVLLLSKAYEKKVLLFACKASPYSLYVHFEICIKDG